MPNALITTATIRMINSLSPRLTNDFHKAPVAVMRHLQGYYPSDLGRIQAPDNNRPDRTSRRVVLLEPIRPPAMMREC